MTSFLKYKTIIYVTVELYIVRFKGSLASCPSFLSFTALKLNKYALYSAAPTPKAYFSFAYIVTQNLLFVKNP